MISYEYLEKMFYRLHEAKAIGAVVAKGADQKERDMCRNWECAITASIRDYIKAHSASQGQEGGANG